MKILIATLFAFVLTSSGAFAQDEGASTSTSRPVDIAVNFTADSLQLPWIKEFRYVVVVNKAVSGSEKQSIRVYEYGQLIRNDKVSTGRDAFEKKGEHHSKHDSWSVTPTGFYTPDYLDIDHKSSSYGGRFSWLVGGVKMPYAIFFNGGIALHQAPKGTEGQLGSSASGGCIRLPGALASDLFARVNETDGAQIPKFTIDGNPKLDAEGHQLYRKGFSALIIVQSQVR
ncbi:MAG: L,D-transpeptidase [Bacteroidia bacterium]|nr:L,D-transpeptidase [Bacteroidia bacterium]